MSICELDFGTSNTTLGTTAGREPVLTALAAGQTAIPSGGCVRFHSPPGRKMIGRPLVA